LKIKEFVRKTESGENIYLSELYCPIFILENSVNKEEHTLIVGTYNETKKTFNKVNLFD
jgi:uncharacterized protein Veg